MIQPAGNQEPRRKRESGKVMCPNWVRGTVSKMLNELDGTHDGVMVAAVALMSTEGFDVQTTEEAVDFDPASYGPAMLWGYSIIAGVALGKVMNTVFAATESPDHFTQKIDDMDERMQQMRNLYETCIREFLQQAINYAGATFQEGKTPNMSVAAGSQLLNLWQRIAASTVKFVQPPESPETPEAHSGGGVKEKPDEAKDEPGDGPGAG